MNKIPSISLRGKNVPKSAIRKLIPFAKDAEKRGIKVHKLNIGQPDVETPQEFWDAVKTFKEKVLAYSPSEGRPEFIDAMIKYYAGHNINFKSDEIITIVGGIEGVLLTLFAVANPGDEIITPEPYYSNYVGITAMTDLKFVPITTTAEKGYHLPSAAEIESKITDKTRAILIASPGNPTGCVYTKEEMEMVAGIAIKHGIFVISDEVYREFAYNGEPVTSIMHIKGVEQHAILIDSMSKRYSACGARLGCIISHNKDFIDSVRAYATVRLSAPTLDQIGIAACINTPQSYFDKVKEDYKNRRDIVVDTMNGIKDVICPVPGGAFYAMVKIKGVDTEEFAKWLLTDFSFESETVLVAPGAGFYATPGLGRDEIRIAYIMNTAVMKRSMTVLAKAIEQYRKTH
ncbi:MAG: pyridoxal phosphate-dependent aminotransferase [Fibrobacteres bacterium]|nr:pyridoxal phosphate-dependent aminotransferase [Fibrobacterota bacterium]